MVTNTIPQIKGTRLSGLLFVIMLVFLFNGWILYFNFQKVSAQEDWVRHTYEVVEQLTLINGEMRGAASNVKSYIITKDGTYAQASEIDLKSVRNHLASAKTLTADNIVQQEYAKDLSLLIDTREAAFHDIERAVKGKGTNLKENLSAFKDDEDQAQEISKVINKMESTEFNLLQWRSESSAESKEIFFFTLVFTTVSSLLIILFGFVQARKNHLLAILKAEEKTIEAREKDTIAEVSGLVAGDPSVEIAGDALLSFFSKNLSIAAAKLYLFDERGQPVIVASHGTDSEKGSQNFEQKLIWDAARRKSAWQLHAIPETYWKIKSGLGSAIPKTLAFLPLNFQGTPIGIVEMALFEEFSEFHLDLLQKLAEPIAVGLNAAQSRQALQGLLERTQQQAEELQAQQEELRVSNEELAAQTDALKEAQANLEGQRAELEQTNDQLEEQARTLEHQKDILNAKNDELIMAQDKVESASRYKSEFLANMSHELRTPLNSSLILAKLLADNPDGNLSNEQVDFAKAISSSGQDLLELINDILDLSKVEAGKLELYIERVWVHKLKTSLEEMFTPLAKQKKLDFEVTIEDGTLEWIESDKQRVEQVLRNLLSNAFKFTANGSVKVSISSQKDAQTFKFQVRDTGIGIPKDKQGIIFDAFKQADGTTNRKFGGTGLGLSISRDLSRLLGGKIILDSEEGKGSVFTFVCPQIYRPVSVTHTSLSAPTVSHAPNLPEISKEEDPATIRHLIADDRDVIADAKRKLLIIEDDEKFAKVLYDLSHEMDFKCVVAGNAEDGYALACQIIPEGILLDVKLPDHSGLWVLDRLKETPQTRHIPVHMFSVEDYSQTALQMGAVGYVVKPAKRKELEEAFGRIEKKLTQKVQRVLVVEDDGIQRAAILKLIGGSDVEITAAANGADALENLKSSIFDCMIVDLNLPDMSGYDLLGQMTKGDMKSYPPVIVYTGRNLTRDEEEELRKYSRSIILKGAKSPERLLSEVGLFLHRVETKMPSDKQKLLQESRNRERIFEGKSILIVDDDVRNIFALTSALESKGAKIEIGRNGIQALEKIDANPKIDLVLMDIMMPEMDGYEAIRRIRKQSKYDQLPVIAITARAMRDDQEKCLEAGANDYLSKPIDLEKLVSLIRVWLTTVEKRS